MKKAVFSISVIAGLLAIGATPVHAGFEWQAPSRAAPAPGPIPSSPASQDMMMEQAPAYPPPPVMPLPMDTQPVQPLHRGPQSQMQNQGGLVINPYPNAGTAAPKPMQDNLADAIMRESGKLRPVPNAAAQLLQAHEAKMAALSPVMRPPQYEVVQGFGREIPLAIALSQVVPAEYTYAFDASVNAGESVSWQGGQPWDQVLANMLMPSGLGADIVDGNVRITQGGGVSAAQPVAASFTPPSAMAQAPRGPDDMMVEPAFSSAPDPDPISASAPSYQTEYSDGVMVSRSSDLQAKKLERPTMPARLSRIQGEEIFEGGLSKPHSPAANEAAPLPDTSLEVSATSAPVPVMPDAAPIEVEPVEPFTVSRSSEDIATPRWDAPETLSMVNASHSYKQRRTWRAVRGDSLREILMEWAQQAGVDLTWNSKYDYPLEASLRIKGTFEEAVKGVLEGLQDARPRPVGRLHPNLPDGPAALIIETQQVIE